MSTILDALKKSEAERSAGTADRTAERPPSTARPARRWSALIAVAAAGIVAGVLVSQWAASPPGAAVRPPGPDSSPLPSAPATAPQMAQATSRPAAGAAPAPTTGHVDAAPTALAAGAQAAPANEAAAGSAGGRLPRPAVTPRTPAATAGDSGKAPEKRTGAAPSVGDAAPSRGNAAQLAVPKPQQQIVAGGGTQTAAPGRQPAERLPGYEQLPALQQQLGDLALSMLVFSNDPGQRFALINGQRLHNGEALASGATLVEIRRAGCVLEYHGQRFLLAVAR